MADFNYQDFIKTRSALPSYGTPTPSYNGQGMSWADFNNKYNQVAAANQLLRNGEIDGTLKRTRDFRMSGGTEGLYNGQYRKASAADWLFNQSLRGGEFLNNLPGEIAGFLGGEKAKKDWTFDANAFDLSNGLDIDDLSQIRNFVVSIPGMIPGGILEGFGKGYEAVTGNPIQEYRDTENGLEIADYELDASQRAAAGIDAAINLVGTFTGPGGRVVGNVGKASAHRLLDSSLKEANKLMKSSGMSFDEALTKVGYSGAREEAGKIWAQAQHRQDLWEGMSKGMVTRALEGASGGKPLGTAVGLFADMGDEAAEEFIQSYADDVRMKNVDEGSFDRALTGAAWGALGGGLMGGAGRALGHFSSLAQEKKERAEDADEPYIPTPGNKSFEEMREGGLENAVSRHYNDALREELAEYARSQTRSAASATALQTWTNPNLKWDDVECGTDEIVQAFFRDGLQGKSARIIAHAFGVEVEDFFNNIVNPQVDNAEYINGLIANSGRGYVQIAVGRNPDTKNGAFLANLTRVYNGSRFCARPEVMKILNSDWDSDTCSLYFDPNELDREEDFEDSSGNTVRPLGYASEMLYDQITGKSNVEWAWAGIGANSEFDKGVLKKALEDILSHTGLKEKVVIDENGNETKEDAVEYYLREISNSLLVSPGESAGDSSLNDDRLSKVLSELLVDVTSANQGDTRFWSGRTALNELLNVLLTDDTAILQRDYAGFINQSTVAMSRILGIDESDPDQAAELDELKKRGEEFLSGEPNAPAETINMYYKRGTLGSGSKFAQLQKAVGFLTYLMNSDVRGNPVFRQYGAVRFWVNSNDLIDEAISTLASIYGVEPVLKTCLRYSFRLTEAGVDPTVAVEGMCDKFIKLKLIDGEGGTKAAGRISTEKDFEAFVKNFIETQSQYSRVYGIVQKVESNQGVVTPYDSPLRNPLDGKLDLNKKVDSTDDLFAPYEGTVDPSKMGRKESEEFFLQAYRLLFDTEISSVFSDPILKALKFHNVEGLTFGQFFDWAESTNPSGGISQAVVGLRGKYDFAADFLIGLAGAKKTTVIRLKQSILNDATIRLDFHGIMQRYESNGNKIDERDVPSLLKLIDFIYAYAGPRNAARAGLVLDDNLLSTPIGNAMMSGDINGLMNLCCKLSIYGQFIDSVRAIRRFKDSSNPQEQLLYMGARDRLSQLSFVSALHHDIAESILVDDNFAPFEWATSLDLSLEESSAYFDEVHPALEDDFVICALQSETGAFALSSVSAKQRKAGLAAKKMGEVTYDAMVGEVSTFLGNFRTAYTTQNNQEELVSYVYDMAYAEMAQYDSDLVTLTVLASMATGTEYVEKATIPEMMSAVYTSSKIVVDGEIVSLLNRISAGYCDCSNMRDWLGNRVEFLKCLTDPNYRRDVWDPDQNAWVTMTQKSLLAECGYKDFSGQLKPDHIIAVLKKWPQVAGYLCSPTVSAMSVGGRDISVGASRYQTLTESFTEWKKARTEVSANEDSAFRYQVDRALRNIKATILTNEKARAYQLVTVALSQRGMLDGRAKASEIKSVTDEILDQLALKAYWYELYADGFASEKERADLTESQRSTLNLQKQIWDLVDLGYRTRARELKESASEGISETIFGDFFGELVTQTVSDLLGVENDFSASGSRNVNDIISNYIKSLEEDTKELMSIALYLSHQVSGASSDVFLSKAMKYIPVDSVISQIETKIREKNPNDTQEEVSARAAMLFLEAEDKLKDFFLGPISEALGISEKFFTTEDLKTDEGRAKAASRIANVLHSDREFGTKEYTDLEKELRSVAEKKNIEDEDGSERLETDFELERRLQDFVNGLNQKVIRLSLARLSRKSLVPVNENAAQLKDQIDEIQRSLINEVLENIRKNPQMGISNSDLIGITEEMTRRHPSWNVDDPPELEYQYTDDTAQAAFSLLSANKSSFGNQTKVGVAGLDQNLDTPFGHIPARMDDPKFAVHIPIVKSEVEKMLTSENDDVLAIIPGEEAPVSIVSSKFRNYLAELPDTVQGQDGKIVESTIEIYHPDENAHGLPTLNSGKKPGPDAVAGIRELHGIFQRIITFAMENMVLKEKKTLNLEAPMLDSNARFKSMPHGSNILSSQQAEAMYDEFRAYRKSLEKNLLDEFSNPETKLSAVNFGKRQARLLSQVFTPGVYIQMEMSYTDENGETKTELIHEFLDASVFMGTKADSAINQDEAIKAILKRRQEQHPNASIRMLSAEIRPMTFSALSRRITDAVNSARYSASKEGRALSAEEAEEATAKALNDWSDYGDRCAGSVGALMSKLPPLPVRSQRQTISEYGQPTQTGKFVNLLTKGALGADLPFDVRARNWVTVHRTEDKNFFDSINDHLFGQATGKPNLPVLEIYSKPSTRGLGTLQAKGAPRKVQIDGMLYTAKNQIQEHKKKTNNTVFGKGLFLVYADTEQELDGLVNSALKEASRRYSWLLVPRDYAEKSQRLTICEGGKTFRIGDVDFVICRDQAYEHKRVILDSQPRSWAIPRTRDSVDITVVYKNDAQYIQEWRDLIRSGDAVVTTFPCKEKKEVRTPDVVLRVPFRNLFPDSSPEPGFDLYERKIISKEEALRYLNIIAYKDENGIWKPKTKKKGKDVDIDFSLWTESILDDGGEPPLKPFILDSSLVESNQRIGAKGSQLASMVVSFLSKLEGTASSDGSLDPNDIGKNEVIALVSNGKSVSPLVSPPSMPSKVETSSLWIEDGYVYFEFSGKTDVYGEESEGAIKLGVNVGWEAFKGMAHALDKDNPDRNQFRPQIADQDGKGFKEVGYAISDESEGSRVEPRDNFFLLDTLYGDMIHRETHLFIERNKETGEYEPKGEIKNWSLEDQQAFFRGDPRIIDKVIDGVQGYSVFKKSDRNEVVQDFLRSIVRQHQTWPFAFFGYTLSPFVGKDGKISYERKDIVSNPLSSTNEPMYMSMNARGILSSFVPDTDSLLLFFNCVDEDACYPSLRARSKDKECKKRVDTDGRYRVIWPVRGEPGRGRIEWNYVRFGENASLGVVSKERTPTGQSSVSPQRVGARGEKGYVGASQAHMEKVYYNSNIASENYEIAYRDYLEDTDLRSSGVKRKGDPFHPNQTIETSIASRISFASKSEMQAWQRVMEVPEKTFGQPRLFHDTKTNEYKPQSQFTKAGSDYFEAKTEWGRWQRDTAEKYNMPKAQPEMSYAELDNLIKCLYAVTWGDNAVIDPKAELEEGQYRWFVDGRTFKKGLETIRKNIEQHHVPFVATPGGSDSHGRYIRCLPPKAAAWGLYESTPELKNYWSTHGGFNAFLEAMKEQQRIAEASILEGLKTDKRSDKARLNALIDNCRSAWFDYGEASTIFPLYDDITFAQVEGDLNSLCAAFAAADHWTKEQVEFFNEFIAATTEKQMAVRRHYENLHVNFLKYNVEGYAQDKAYSVVDEARTLTNFFRTAADLSKVMSILNPGVFAGNVVDRAIHQGTMRASISLAQKLKVAPYKVDKDHAVDPNIRKRAANDSNAIEFLALLRELEYKGEDAAMISKLIIDGSYNEALEYARSRKNPYTGVARHWGSIRDAAYKFASGGRIGIKNQVGLLIDRFVAFAEEEGLWFWFEPVEGVLTESGEPMTQLEYLLSQEGGFAKFMARCLTPGDPSYSAFMKAMNSSKTGDMAQKNALGVVIVDILKRIPFSDFFVTTAISRFPMYGLNVTGRALSYILPMSSINYAFNSWLGKTNYGKALGIDEIQVMTSMREAMLADVFRLGLFGTALVLFGLNAVQPPDDEKKWGNIDEWLIFGTRAGENWWVQDILSMALPMACFWKAVSLGKPRMDIILNGVADLCYSNPVVRCGDVAAWLMNPEENLLSGFDETKKMFENAKGGAPDLGQYIQTSGFSFGMNWLSQFFTPSFVREWYRASTPLEKSYKRTWKKSASGAVTEKGLYGATETLTYDEAMKHKLTQRNPVLAWLFSVFSGDDSYWLNNMPNTVMYDDYQLAATEGTSISGLSEDLKRAKVADIICVLQGVDDVDAFVKETGFHLDYETLIAVSSQVWDLYHSVDDWYNTLKANGQLNYTYLGNGDWDEGQKIAGELAKQRDSMKQYWYDFYYTKLKNTAIGKQIVMYNRYNTTYGRDVNGEVYATGIRRTPFDFLPFTTSPGTISSPEGTAGYSNDFASVSAVTGLPLDNRALIPIEEGALELPAFEELSANKDGNGYSSQYRNTTDSSSSTSYPRSSGGSGGSGGGGGGGGYRSSAGGFYAPSVSLPRANSSRIMNTDRAIKPNYDYLRPDFETKGSREAYRRSDI